MRVFALLIVFGLSLFGPNRALTQTDVNIALISDDYSPNANTQYFEQLMKDEILALVSNTHNVTFSTFFIGFDPVNGQNTIEKLLADTVHDLLISVGSLSSNLLLQQDAYPKPVISSIVLMPDKQDLPMTANNTSGVHNLTYLETPFLPSRDIRALYRYRPFNKLSVVGTNALSNNLPHLNAALIELCDSLGAAYEYVPSKQSGSATASAISDDTDAVFILPLFDAMDSSEVRVLVEAINDRKIPSAALFGELFVDMGALMGYEADQNVQRMPRRVAINVLKILQGTPASDLDVLMQTYNHNLLINMATAREIGVYPDWDLMSESILLNVTSNNSDETIDLKQAIAIAMDENLGLRAARLDPRIQAEELKLAKVELRPQIDGSSLITAIDEVRAGMSFGTQGRLNWTVSGGLSQVVFSEPALANVAIQKFLQKATAFGLETEVMDMIIEVSEAYLGLLQAKAFVRIQNENVRVTKKNLDIARIKEKLGYAGASDTYRWESELALDNVDLNNAQAQQRNAEYRLNLLMNRPLKAFFQTEEAGVSDGILVITDERIFGAVNNPGDLSLFADFMVEEALKSRPELNQLRENVSAQDRLAKSFHRSRYLPSLFVDGGWDKTLERWDVPLAPGQMEAVKDASWNVSLGVQYPIFQGGKRNIQTQQSRIELDQIRLQEAYLVQQLELDVRSALENAGASYSAMVLNEDAATAAAKNFDIVQDAYEQGLINITSLIDAQNASVQTELAAANAIFQFLIDFLKVDRSVGTFLFLIDPAEEDAFFERFNAFMTSKNGNND